MKGIRLVPDDTKIPFMKFSRFGYFLSGGCKGFQYDSLCLVSRNGRYKCDLFYRSGYRGMNRH